MKINKLNFFLIFIQKTFRKGLEGMQINLLKTQKLLYSLRLFLNTVWEKFNQHYYTFFKQNL